MDLSKLPRKPQVPDAGFAAPGNPPASPSTPRPSSGPPHAAAPVGLGADIWFMSIVGLVLILYGGSFASYELAQLRHQPYHTNVTWQTGDKAGEEVAYPDLDAGGVRGGQYYTDSCLFLFGVALVMDGVGRGLAVTRMPGGLGVLGFTIALTLATVGYNVFVASKYLAADSRPFISGLVIASGGYVAIMQIALFKSLVLRRSRA